MERDSPRMTRSGAWSRVTVRPATSVISSAPEALLLLDGVASFSEEEEHPVRTRVEETAQAPIMRIVPRRRMALPFCISAPGYLARAERLHLLGLG